MIRVGVDVGGTFTDIVLERSGGGVERQVVVTKVSSTPHDQSEAVVEGILKVAALAGVEPGAIDAVFHGTTVATNMVIERAGAKVGMITTRGFRDILHMARHKRPHNFSLQFDLPWQSKPLVRRRDRLAVTERIMPPTGTVEVPLAEDEVKEAAELFAKRGMDAVIVAFLFSFLNNEHEQRAKEIVKSILPDAFVSASSDVVNTIREYERFSSAAMNAYIGPKTSAYLRNLEGRLRKNGIEAMVRIMQSNGGISTIENSSELPIGLLLSGPAGGVIGGRWTGEHSGKTNIITIDIGGTSADISVIENGELRIKNPRDTEVAGLPVLVPMIDIDAIGAGGGSIAYIDPGGAFRVGPRSAGAVPGPACYAKGGEEPTVTDAQVVLGRMDPEHFLGGDLKIDASLVGKGHPQAHRRAAQAFGRTGRAGHPEDHQQQHGAGDQRQLGRQGRRPPQFLADGFWRRGAAAFGVAGRSDLRQRRDLAGASGHHRRDRPAGDRPAVRIHTFHTDGVEQRQRGGVLPRQRRAR